MDNAVESVIIAAIKQRMSMRSGNARYSAEPGVC